MYWNRHSLDCEMILLHPKPLVLEGRKTGDSVKTAAAAFNILGSV